MTRQTIQKKNTRKKNKSSPGGKRTTPGNKKSGEKTGSPKKSGAAGNKKSGKSVKGSSSRKKVSGSSSAKKKAGKKNHRGSFWQIIAVILFLSASLAALKHYFLDISLEQAKRIRIAQETTAGENGVLLEEDKELGRPEIIQDFLTPNSYSRSEIKIGKVRGIVVHYVANPGSSAKENRDYFEGLKDTHLTKASSHYVIGIEGEIIQCIPLDEISYASNDRNNDTISIECCHPGKDGKFSEATYASLLDLVCWLCDTYGLKSSDVIRHYDVTGKECPLYFVRHPDKWQEFRQDIDSRLE